MPLYSWKCSNCSKEMDVLRSFADYSDPPSTEEVGVCDCDEKRGATPHTWERRMSAPRVERGPNWRTSKGNH